MTTSTKPIITHLCPSCGKELDYDEVDIEVGTMIGNLRCSNCGWIPEDLFPNLFTKECEK